jgi:YfiR/HmsC-like
MSFKNSAPSTNMHQARLAIRAGTRCLLALGLWLGAAGCPGLAVGQEVVGVIDREYAIKAAFLYHFSNYVEWPAESFSSPDQPFVIGVYGTNPFGAMLDEVAHKKKVDGRAIQVRVVKSIAEAERCQILFVPASVPRDVQDAVLRATIQYPVLAVGETDDFVNRGGNVQFFLEGNKVRFAFGADALKRDDLKVSSKLLALAKIIAGR